MEAEAAGAAEFEKPRGPRSGDLDMAMGAGTLGSGSEGLRIPKSSDRPPRVSLDQF